MAKLRKCRVFVDGAFQEAAFHGNQKQVVLGSDNEPRECTVAVVELKDGTVMNFEPNRIKFLEPPESEQESHIRQESDASTNRDLLIKVEQLKNILVTRATGGEPPEAENEYQKLRRELIAIPLIKNALPVFVNSCRTVKEFWQFIKPTESYAARRELLRLEFHPLLEVLEQGSSSAPIVGDPFRRQFPAGLPFGLSKPDMVAKPHGGTQVVEFEDASNVGVIRSGAYPCLTFGILNAALSGTPVAQSKLEDKLVALNQTESEKTFFREYASTFSMFTADVPVLVPQAWIQWHSLRKADLREAGSSYSEDLYRVDFVVFWNNQRFAILVDDIGHYAKKVANRWDANEMQYANRLKEDRKLRKEGWQVFRLSNWEIRSGGLKEILVDLKEFVQF